MRKVVKVRKGRVSKRSKRSGGGRDGWRRRVFAVAQFGYLDAEDLARCGVTLGLTGAAAGVLGPVVGWSDPGEGRADQ